MNERRELILVVALTGSNPARLSTLGLQVKIIPYFSVLKLILVKCTSII